MHSFFRTILVWNITFQMLLILLWYCSFFAALWENWFSGPGSVSVLK